MYRVATTRIFEKPKIIPGVTQASAPPVRIASAYQLLMSEAAYAIASVELVQPVEMT